MTRTIFIVFAQLGFSHNTTEQFRHTAFFAAAAKCSFLRTLRVMLARTVISASCFAVHRKEKNLARKSTAPQLKIIPLGGLGEIGKNMTVLEYNEDIIVIDCGLAFPDEEMPGIDMVIPDMSYLEQNAERLRAFIITHGHEDHIGAISYALEKFKVPVFGTKFTLALIEHKLHEHHVEDTCLECINAGDVIEIGCFKIEFIKVSHSIAGAVALAVTTPVGIIVHTGDFKVDYTPIDNEPIDINSFARYGTKGVLALLMDSTNAELSGVTPSEKELGKTFEKVFTEAEGRIIVASFASNVYRIQQVVDTAVRHNRVICFQGRSMVMITKIAKDLGYLELPEDSVVELEKLKNYENNRVCVLTTGSQGESMSGLFRMANANHKLIIGKGDTVIISASAIPGNEKSVGRVINQLFQRGANVVYDRLADVHVSGHACQEDIKLIYSLVKPKYAIPVHGEYRHLVAQAKIAEELGIDKENIFLLSSGDVLELDEESAAVTGHVQVGDVMVDGLGVGDVGNIVLRDRQHLAEEGIIIVVMTLESGSGMVLAGPDIVSRGFVYVRGAESLMEEARHVLEGTMEHCMDKNITDWSKIKTEIKDALGDFVWKETKRRPMIIPIIMEV